jgi:hypothetical protein
MVGAAPAPSWLFTDWLLAQFGNNRTAARLNYARFVAEGHGLASPWTALKGQVMLGMERFVENLPTLIEKKSDLKDLPKAQRLAYRPNPEAIFSREIRADKGMRDEAIRVTYLQFGYSMAAIARHLEIHHSTAKKGQVLT